MGVLSQSGRRVISFFLPAGPTRTVRSSRASEDGSCEDGVGTKEENEGPLFRRSWNVVRGRVVVWSVADGSEAAVASVREIGETRPWKVCLGDKAEIYRSLGAFVAIAETSKIYVEEGAWTGVKLIPRDPTVIQI